jgi:hypothetical protein
LHDLPESPVTKEATDGNGHDAFKLKPHFPIPLYGLDVIPDILAARLLHVACKAFLDPFPDPAETGPGEPKPINELAELPIFHLSILSFFPIHYKKFDLLA